VYAVGLGASKKLALRRAGDVEASQTPLATPNTRGSGPLRRIRTGVICSGQANLRARGLFERYKTLLDPGLRRTILAAVPGGWSPVEVAMGHVAACQDLGISREDAFESGAMVGEHLNGVVVETMARLAVGVGATPWTVLGVYGRLFRRLVDGSSFTVERSSPNEARIELEDMPLCGFSFFRDAFRGSHHAALRRFATEIRVDEIQGSAHSDGVAIRISWE
jgi:hypothetical protein